MINEPRLPPPSVHKQKVRQNLEFYSEHSHPLKNMKHPNNTKKANKQKEYYRDSVCNILSISNSKVASYRYRTKFFCLCIHKEIFIPKVKI